MQLKAQTIQHTGHLTDTGLQKKQNCCSFNQCWIRIGDPTTGADTEQWFVGLQWDEIGAGTLGAAVGTNGAISEGGTDYYMYEAFYSYPVNDGMTITPLIYVSEGATDTTGIMVQTTFSF